MTNLLKLGAFAALLCADCGSPMPPGDGDNIVGIHCETGPESCATFNIVVSRPARVEIDNTDLTIRYETVVLFVPRATTIHLKAPAQYLICAFADGIADPVCEQVEVVPGDRKAVTCTFPEDRAEKKAVRVPHTELEVPVALTLDGNAAELDPDGAVLIPMDRETHIVSARATGYVANDREIDTSRLVPNETDKVIMGYDMGGRSCTGVEGHWEGQTTIAEMVASVRGVEIVLFDSPIPLEGFDFLTPVVCGDGSCSVTGHLSQDGSDIELVSSHADGSTNRDHLTCTTPR